METASFVSFPCETVSVFVRVLSLVDACVEMAETWTNFFARRVNVFFKAPSCFFCVLIKLSNTI